MKIKTNDVTPKLDGDRMYDEDQKNPKNDDKCAVLQLQNVIQKATVVFCSYAGEKGKVLPNHISNRCFSKMLRTVLEGGVSDHVSHKFGDLQ